MIAATDLGRAGCIRQGRLRHEERDGNQSDDLNEAFHSSGNSIPRCQTLGCDTHHSGHVHSDKRGRR